tara:strand:- start:131 stop:406 length:276 start_codon:yes stop_codon:yes gene_type:complete
MNNGYGRMGQQVYPEFYSQPDPRLSRDDSRSPYYGTMMNGPQMGQMTTAPTSAGAWLEYAGMIALAAALIGGFGGLAFGAATSVAPIKTKK